MGKHGLPKGTGALAWGAPVFTWHAMWGYKRGPQAGAAAAREASQSGHFPQPLQTSPPFNSGRSTFCCMPPQAPRPPGPCPAGYGPACALRGAASVLLGLWLLFAPCGVGPGQRGCPACQKRGCGHLPDPIICGSQSAEALINFGTAKTGQTGALPASFRSRRTRLIMGLPAESYLLGPGRQA